jgi:hypothetical protein
MRAIFFLLFLGASAAVFIKDLPPPLSQSDFFKYFAYKGYRAITGTYVIPDHTISLVYSTDRGMAGIPPCTDLDVKTVAAYAMDLVRHNSTGDMWRFYDAVLVLHVINDTETRLMRAMVNVTLL